MWTSGARQQQQQDSSGGSDDSNSRDSDGDIYEDALSTRGSRRSTSEDGMDSGSLDLAYHSIDRIADRERDRERDGSASGAFVGSFGAAPPALEAVAAAPVAPPGGQADLAEIEAAVQKLGRFNRRSGGTPQNALSKLKIAELGSEPAAVAAAGTAVAAAAAGGVESSIAAAQEDKARSASSSQSASDAAGTAGAASPSTASPAASSATAPPAAGAAASTAAVATTHSSPAASAAACPLDVAPASQTTIPARSPATAAAVDDPGARLTPNVPCRSGSPTDVPPDVLPGPSRESVAGSESAPATSCWPASTASTSHPTSHPSASSAHTPDDAAHLDDNRHIGGVRDELSVRGAGQAGAGGTPEAAGCANTGDTMQAPSDHAVDADGTGGVVGGTSGMASRSTDNEIQPVVDAVSSSAISAGGTKHASAQVLPPPPAPAEDEEPAPLHAHAAHFFMLTNSGRPVYARHGGEAALTALSPLICAIMSVVEDQGDVLQTLRAPGGTLVVFMTRGPLQLVATSRQNGVPVVALQKQLEMLYRQIVSIVTTGLERILMRNPSYDARNLLEGTAGVLGALTDSMQTSPAYLYSALQPMTCPPADRAVASSALAEAVKRSDAFYGVLMVDDLAVALEAGHHQPALHPLDLLVLSNFVTCNPSHRYGQSESFCPVCLPHYNPAVFLHAYITYLDANTGLYLVLLAGSSESFYALRTAKARLQQALAASGVYMRLRLLLTQRPEGRVGVFDLPRPTGGRFGETPLWHYVLKVPSKKQVLVAGFAKPFETPAGRAELTRAYAQLFGLMHESADDARPNKLVWQCSSSCAMLASIDRDSEAFLVLDPLTGHAAALEVLEALRRHWLSEPHRSDAFL